MAANLDIIIQAQDRASATFKQVSSGLGDMSRIAGSFVIGSALTALPGLLMSAGKAAAEDAASQARLQQAVDNTGTSYSTYSKHIEGVIANGQKLGFTDDQTRSSLSILTAQTGSATEAMKRYALAQDLSRGANIDVVTASRLLGKVTEENVNVLNRYGISVQKGASETELFAAINTKFHGQAAAFAETTAGKYAILADRVGELKESFGQLLIPVANLAATQLEHSLQGWEAIFRGAGNAVNFLSDAFRTGEPVLDSYHRRLKELGQTEQEDVANIFQYAGAVDALSQHLAGLDTKQREAANAGSLLVAAQVKSIQSSADQARATETAYTELAKSNLESDRAIANAHYQEIADRAAAAASSEASKAKSAQAEAARAFAETIPGMVAELYKQDEATRKQNAAQMIYNQQMGIATDRMGKAIPTMKEMIDTQLDSIDASIRQSKVSQTLAQTSFPMLVEEQKQSILASQAMAKATEEANRQLGIISDTATSASAAIRAFNGVMWGPNGEWVPVNGGSSAGGSSSGSVPSGVGQWATKEQLATIHRAAGGPVSAGVAYTVGENGPETFIPGQSGRIAPNGGDGPVNIVLQIPGMEDFVVRTTRKAILGGGFRGVLRPA